MHEPMKIKLNVLVWFRTGTRDGALGSQ